MGNPWEILRNDISYPVKFYGKVVSGSDGKKHWIGGEDIKAVAYDVPIPGYKTKTTINLRLWSTKAPSEDLDLYAFNAGDHTKAYEALSNAEKVCVCVSFFLILTFSQKSLLYMLHVNLDSISYCPGLKIH
jgi:starch phosphorylase